ncbi:hypothetical protein [Flavobacterium sp.]|uniref:hypothetical protein n=1 Tax=Flavobacterium sp. TaxID=239 RepID=UPI003750B0E3
MKKLTTLLKIFCSLILFFSVNKVTAQIGIGTVTPNVSSLLDITSTTKGMLTPRMTTVQRDAIVTPADGLIVYDTDFKSFYHYNVATSTWIRIGSDVNGRTKYKLIKSTDVLATVLATELAAGGGTKYLMDSGTYYEINGTILFSLSIELNNCYLVGLDGNDDKVIKTGGGDLFVGSTGGTIKVLTLSVTAGGTLFNILGTGAVGTNTQSIIIRDCIIASWTSLGKIENFGLVFVNILQYVGNANGITYKDITRLLISNAGWFGNNTGTFEKIQGNFSIITKQGGFSEVNGAAVGFDVSANPIITNDAVIEGTVFTGVLTTGKFVNGYTPTLYPGYNFNNSWIVRCAGLPVETDAVSTGNLFDPNNTAATTTVATTQNVGYKVVTNATTATNLFRFDSPTTGRLTYRGKKTRTFQVSASISFTEVTGGANTTYVFYFVKILADGTTVVALPETETYNDTNGGFIQSFPVTGSVVLNKDEGVEVYLKRVNTGARINVNTYSFNITVQ